MHSSLCVDVPEVGFLLLELILEGEGHHTSQPNGRLLRVGERCHSLVIDNGLACSGESYTHNNNNTTTTTSSERA